MRINDSTVYSNFLVKTISHARRLTNASRFVQQGREVSEFISFYWDLVYENVLGIAARASRDWTPFLLHLQKKSTRSLESCFDLSKRRRGAARSFFRCVAPELGRRADEGKDELVTRLDRHWWVVSERGAATRSTSKTQPP
jgi:hypothetical protein